MNKTQLKSDIDNQSVIKKNISSPLAIMPHGSPSVDSIFKSTPPSVLVSKDIPKSCESDTAQPLSHTQQLDDIPKNIFSSPLEKEGVKTEQEPVGRKEDTSATNEVKSEGGALDAASALLMISN